MTATSRHAPPVRRYADGSVAMLKRLLLGQGGEDAGQREAFVQNLVHDFPDVLPMADIEPAFTPLLSVCKELGTPAGNVDNLWVTPSGGLVLGECKLVRNPEARREVVAQCLDYARAIGTWSFGDLEIAIRKARKEPSFTLWSLVAESPETDLDEAQFVDAVERRLRTGRLMLLIIGDGIQEGVEALSAHLQMHAGIHAGLALVDLSIWSDPAGGILVVPRVPMRTVLIERGIVTFNPASGVQVGPPTETGMIAGVPAKAVTLSEPEYYEQLAERRGPDLRTSLQAFLSTLPEIGIEPIFRRSMVLRFRPSPDVEASAGYVDRGGLAYFVDPWIAASKAGRTAVGDAYLQALANIIGGKVLKKPGAAWPSLIGVDGKASPDLGLLLKHADAWREAMRNLVEAMKVED